jgi:hypothetical protein
MAKINIKENRRKNVKTYYKWWIIAIIVVLVAILIWFAMY